MGTLIIASGMALGAWFVTNPLPKIIKKYKIY
jgi:hypothetical protein